MGKCCGYIGESNESTMKAGLTKNVFVRVVQPLAYMILHIFDWVFDILILFTANVPIFYRVVMFFFTFYSTLVIFYSVVRERVKVHYVIDPNTKEES